MNHKWYIYPTILIIVLISILIRSQNLPYLEGRYPLDNDSVRFLRQAKIIIEHGKLPKNDMMRWQPFGRDMTRQLSLSSYAIAYLHRLIRFFIPSINVEKTAIYYPIICFSFSILVFFALIMRLFDKHTALISTIFFAVFPTLVLRSMAGFSDRDPFCMFLSFVSFYLFIRSIQTKRKRYKFIFAFASGLFMMFLGLAWEGSGLFIAIIALFHLARFLIDNYDRENLYTYLLWVLPILLGLLIFTRTYRNFTPFSILALGTPSFVLSVYILHFVFGVSKALVSFVTLGSRLSLNFSALIIVILSLLLITGISFILQPTTTFREILALKDNFITPLGQSRLIQSLSELQRPNSIDWVSRYGVLFILLSVGAVLSMQKLALSIRFEPWLSMLSLEILMMGVFFSRFSPNLPSNKESSLSFITYFSSIFLFLFTMFGLYLYNHKGLHTQEKKHTRTPEETLFSLIWFILLMLPARGAIRYDFFFAPIAMSFGCYAVTRLFKAMRGKILSKPFRILSYLFTAILVILLVILILGNQFIASYSIVKTTKPLISKSWIKALEWMKYNIPKNSIIASWWDNGSWINTIGERATIVDEDHYIPYWIYLMGRYVMLGQTESEALEFLKSHNATHLITSTNDVLFYPVISTIGSNENFDRYSYIPLFLPDKDLCNYKVNFFRYTAPGGKAIIDDILHFNGKVHGRKTCSIVGILLKTIGINRGSWQLDEAVIELEVDGKIVKIPPQEIYFKGNVTQIKGESLPCSIVIYSKSNNPTEWKILFLSEMVRNSIIVKLHILNKGSNIFIPIYPIINMGKNDQFHDYSVRIWKINYPKNIQSKSTYLETEFSDPKLYRSWVLGKK